jgi:NAD(P)-dependent dehydrogenase (short-subunit alcohol dehydrogenase family)
MWGGVMMRLQRTAWWQDLLLIAGAGYGLSWALLKLREADLRDQVVLITGGSRGLGFALAQRFLTEGCRVAICARDAEELAFAQADLKALGGMTLALQCDVSDPEQVAQMVETVRSTFGHIDILVNNAGTIRVGPLAEMTLEDFHRAHDTIYWGMVNTTLAVLPQMRARRSGRIVNITSIGGKIPVPHLAAYSAAKFAAVGFSENLRLELLEHDIYVTTVVPGLMRTGSHLRAKFKGQQSQEFTLFSLIDNTPGVSTSAEHAANAIVQATRRGQSELVLTLPAKVASRIHGLLPGTTTDLLSLVNRRLPGATGGSFPFPGWKVRVRLESPLLNRLLGIGEDAAQRYNQYVGIPAQPYESDTAPQENPPAF